jgi:hypothetical protein
MRLAEWEVRLRDYPGVPALAPFAGWVAARPTDSLSWYDAYNATKHDRESQFARATLDAAVRSVAALFVLQCAQWGPEVFSLFFQNRTSPFVISRLPQWAPGEFYVPELGRPPQWTPRLYFPNGI